MQNLKKWVEVKLKKSQDLSARKYFNKITPNYNKEKIQFYFIFFIRIKHYAEEKKKLLEIRSE